MGVPVRYIENVPATPPLERFFRHVHKTDDCWLWVGTTGGTKSTYGYFRHTSTQFEPKVLAHRWIYEQLVGDIPSGYQIDHLCRNPLCVRPDHLEAVTPTENNKRARLEVCRSQRHDLTDPRNVRWDSQGRRRGCLPCHRESQRARSLLR